jgi:hypothetical protein
MYGDMDLPGKITSMATIICTHTYKACGMKPMIKRGKDWLKIFATPWAMTKPTSQNS